MNLTSSYAPDSFGGLKQVRAALEYAIARLAGEIKPKKEPNGSLNPKAIKQSNQNSQHWTQEDDTTSSADDKRKALNLAQSYAPQSFGSLSEVGAALEYALARLAGEIKQKKSPMGHW